MIQTMVQYDYYYLENGKITEVPVNLPYAQMIKQYGKRGLYRDFIPKHASGSNQGYNQDYEENLTDDGCGHIGHWSERKYY